MSRLMYMRQQDNYLERYNQAVARLLPIASGNALTDAKTIYEAVSGDGMDYAIILCDMIYSYTVHGRVTDEFPEFMRICMTNQTPPYFPTKFQTILAKKLISNDRLLIGCSRQLGTTTLLTGYATYKALNNPNHRVLYLCDHAVSTQFIRRLPPSFIQSASSGYVHLYNGSMIFFTRNQSARGLNADTVIVDGMYNMTDDIFSRIMPSMRASAQLVVAGLPCRHFKFLWEDTDYEKISFSWKDNQLLTPQSIMHMKAMMSPAQWATEYECELS